MLCQADYAEERLDAHEEFEEELNQALYIRKMIDTGMHDRALERLMASTEARKRTRPTRLTDVAPSIFFLSTTKYHTTVYSTNGRRRHSFATGKQIHRKKSTL